MYGDKEYTLDECKKIKEKRQKLENEKLVLSVKTEGSSAYFTKRILPQIKSGSFLIFKEKHGDRYFDASSKEVFFKGVLKILKERYEDGYWYRADPIDKLETLDIDEIESLPNTEKFDKIKKEAIQKYYQYEQMYINYLREVDYLSEIKFAIDNNDGIAAYLLLEGRRNHQYEEFQFESFEQV